MTNDGQSFVADFERIDSDWNFHFRVANQPQRIHLSQLTRWGEYADAIGENYVCLADGGYFVGEVQRISADTMSIYAEPWGQIETNRRGIRGVVIIPPAAALKRDLLLRQIEQASGINDVVLLRNGDQLTGRAIALDNQDNGHPESLQLVRRPSERPLTVAWQDVTAIIFTPALLDPVRTQRTSAVVGLHTGTLLNIESVSVDAGTAELVLAGGQTLRCESKAIWDEVRFIQPQTGQLTYLSDLKPSSYKHIPFLRLSWSWASDRNVLGGRLRANRSISLKGIGMHSSARITYPLEGRYRNFLAELALDEQAGLGGSVTFQVFLKGQSATSSDRWTLAYKSPPVRGGQAPLPISVDVVDAKQLALIVGFADRGDQLDYANWLNARLVPMR